MPKNNYDVNKKIWICADEMCQAVAETMAEEPFISIIEGSVIMQMSFALFGAKVAAKLFEEKKTKGNVENDRSN